jgi:hypothetical protein
LQREVLVDSEGDNENKNENGEEEKTHFVKKVVNWADYLENDCADG